MHKEELLALCRLHSMPFAEDPTNRDTFYLRNRLRKLLSDAALSRMPPQQDTPQNHDSHRHPSELQLSHKPQAKGQPRTSCGASAAPASTQTSSRAEQAFSADTTSDALRVMRACRAASRKLQEDADMLLKRASLQGAGMLLDLSVLHAARQPVAVRALATALQVCMQSPCLCPLPWTLQGI